MNSLCKIREYTLEIGLLICAGLPSPHNVKGNDSNAPQPLALKIRFINVSAKGCPQLVEKQQQLSAFIYSIKAVLKRTFTT